MIRVLASGADGRMGSETVKAVLADNELEFVGGTSLMNVGKDAGEVIGISSLGLPLYGSLNEALKTRRSRRFYDAVGYLRQCKDLY